MDTSLFHESYSMSCDSSTTLRRVFVKGHSRCHRLNPHSEPWATQGLSWRDIMTEPGAPGRCQIPLPRAVFLQWPKITHTFFLTTPPPPPPRLPTPLHLPSLPFPTSLILTQTYIPRLPLPPPSFLTPIHTTAFLIPTPVKPFLRHFVTH